MSLFPSGIQIPSVRNGKGSKCPDFLPNPTAIATNATLWEWEEHSTTKKSGEYYVLYCLSEKNHNICLL